MQPAAVYSTGRCAASTHPLTHGASGAAGAARTGPSSAGWLQQQRCGKKIYGMFLLSKKKREVCKVFIPLCRISASPHCQAVPRTPAQPSKPSCVQPQPRGCVCVTQPLRSSPALPAPWSQCPRLAPSPSSRCCFFFFFLVLGGGGICVVKVFATSQQFLPPSLASDRCPSCFLLILCVIDFVCLYKLYLPSAL